MQNIFILNFPDMVGLIINMSFSLVLVNQTVTSFHQMRTEEAQKQDIVCFITAGGSKHSDKCGLQLGLCFM